MKKYLDHIKSKPAHERRTHAMQISGIAVAAVFVVWLTTLGLRFALPASSQNNGSTQVANAVSAQSGNATLLVASTTDGQ